MLLNTYWDTFTKSFGEYWNYLVSDVTSPGWHSYFYWLLLISAFFYLLELVMPWRKEQPKLRKDFWLDFFYMFFNFFLFGLIGFIAISNVFTQWFDNLLLSFGWENAMANHIHMLPIWGQLLVYFIIRDFIQFNTHRMLHRVPFLWEFHKVHHSVEQMGFAAHLRYHWMENVVYKSIQYIPLGMLGLGLDGYMLLHLVALTIGHFNHSNINVPLGPLKYIFNNPQMHIWHHAKKLPNKYGVNFGISLSIWDYLFRTNYIPKSGRDVPLGFDGDEKFPSSFMWQSLFPFIKRK